MHYEFKMEQIILKNSYFLELKRLKSRAGLSIFEEDVEKVCHKERLKNLKDFVQFGENHLFKGSLQLHKHWRG